MKERRAGSSEQTSVAEALPDSVPLALFLGGPFSTGGTAWRSTFTEMLRRFAVHAGEEDLVMNTLLGPLGRAGFDPLNPGRVGLSSSPGLAFFHAPQAVGLAAAVRSPKKFREALQGAVRRRIRSLKVPGAAEAGWGVIDDGWEVAFARRPPWVYALFGPEIGRTAAATLTELVAGPGRQSLAACRAFRQAAAGSGGVHGDLALWIGDRVVSLLGPEAGEWKERLGPWSQAAGRAGSLLDAMIRLHGGALGLSVSQGELRLEGLALAEGRWLDALDTTVGGGSQGRIGPRALARNCPVWAVSVLDWTLLVRALPVIGEALERVTGPLGDLLRRSGGGGQERANGIVALGLCGLRPDLLEGTSTDGDDLPMGVDAFLVLEMLGRNVPAQIAGRLLDAVGDVVRHGAKRLRGAEDEQLTSMVVAGFRLYVAMRRGAVILATSREALAEARQMLEQGVPESMAPGFLVGGEVEVQSVMRMVADASGLEAEGPFPDELLHEVQRWGATRFQVERVPAGLRLLLRQSLLTGEP